VAQFSGYLSAYLDHGFSRIVVIDHEHSESGSGHVETTNETFIARKGKKFIKAVLHEHLRFLGGPGHGVSIVSEEEISEREYLKLSADKEIIDSPAALSELGEMQRQRAKRDDLYKKFMATAPACPKCGGNMTNRKGPRGDFWGCNGFPECRGSANFSPESRKRYHDYSNG
jgi:hypothetical protein